MLAITLSFPPQFIDQRIGPVIELPPGGKTHPAGTVAPLYFR